MNTLRISIIGLAGSGKSTCASFIEDLAREEGRTFSRVKLAKPLYDLQDAVYAAAGATLAPGAQDQILMETLADALRRINPNSLADDFSVRLARTQADIVVNDDLRDPYVDAPRLRSLGFRILRVTCPEELRQKRLAERGDPTLADRSTRQLDLIEPDVWIDNSGDLESYRAAVREAVRNWR